MAVEIGIDAGVTPFLRKLDSLSDAATSEARQIASALDSGITSSSKSFGVSLDGIGAKFDGLGDVAEKALKKMGSAGGEVADVIFDFGLPLAKMASGFGTAGVAALAVGGAVTAIGVAAGISAAAVYGVVNAAEAARDRLEEAGLAATIPPDALASLDAYQASSKRLGNEFDRLTVILGAKLAPIVTAANDALANLAHWLSTTAGGAEDAGNAMGDYGDAVNPAVEATQDLSLVVGQDAFYAFLGVDGPITTTATNLESRFTPAMESGALAARGMVADLDKLNAALKRTPPEMAKLSEVAAETAVIIKSANQQTLDSMRNYAVQAVTDVAEGVGTITDLIIGNYERRVAAGEKLSQTEMQNANRLAALAKAASISAMTVSAIVTWFALIRDLAAIPGNAPFAIPEATGIVLAGMIAPAAQILGEPIPFPGAGGGGHEVTGGGVAPTDAGPAPDQNSNVRDNGYGSAPGVAGSGRSSRTTGPTTLTLSRTAAQLLQIAPPGKSTRGMR